MLGVHGEPVDHADLLRRDRRPIVQVRAGLRQHIAVHARLQPRREPALPLPLLPVFQSTITARPPGSIATRSIFATRR